MLLENWNSGVDENASLANVVSMCVGWPGHDCWLEVTVDTSVTQAQIAFGLESVRGLALLSPITITVTPDIEGG